MRVDALLSRYGYCSRREAAQWVKAGRVVYQGVTIKSAAQKISLEGVLVDGKDVPFPHGLYVALHKPLGYTCSHDEAGDIVDDLLPAQWLRRKGGVQTVGRLDKETSGLLLLSDDGSFVHALTSPKRHVCKRYRFETQSPVPSEARSLFASGEFLLERERHPCLPAELVMDKGSQTQGVLVLHEGRYHQVRRMLAQLGAPVVRLHREAIGSLQLSELQLDAGEWVAIDPAIFLKA